MTTGIRSIIIVVLLGSCLTALAADEDTTRYFYTWTDDAGLAHGADSLEKVPAKYRSRAKRVAQGVMAPPAGPGNAAPAPAREGQAADDVQLKAVWQERMRDARSRLQFAADAYKQLEARRAELSRQWGAAGAALPPQDALDEMKRLDGEIPEARRKADEARNVVNVVIPEEARKAGIPPGWLREVE